jgi:hypothetical protein
MDGCQLFTEVEVGRRLNFKYIKCLRFLPCDGCQLFTLGYYTHKLQSRHVWKCGPSHKNPAPYKYGILFPCRLKPFRHKAFGLPQASKSPSTPKLPKLLKNVFVFMGCYICTMLEGCFVCLFHFLLWIAYPHGNDSFPKCCKVLVDLITLLHFPKTNKTLTQRYLHGHWWLSNKTLILSPDMVIQFGMANL